MNDFKPERVFIAGLLLLVGTLGMQMKAQTPMPPPGKIWILNPEMSDEFDANSPGDKWRIYDKADSWDRTAAFDKRVQEVQGVSEDGEDNYILAMNPMWYEEVDIFSKSGRTYYFAGGGMNTRAYTTYGYMEVRIKASNFPMGSGVFMHSLRNASDHPCGEKYRTELDIIENMSYDGPGASDFWNGYNHTNTHVKPTDENCNELPTMPFGGGSKALEGPLDFNVVGAWWKNKDSVDFYLNGNYWHTIEFQRDFNLEMPVILTMETYTWGSDENNADNPKPEEYMFQENFRTKEERAVYYDWVRTWQLVNIDTSEFNEGLDNVGFYQDSIQMYKDSIINLTLLYSATESREIIVSVYNGENLLLGADTTYSELGVKSFLASMQTDSVLPTGSYTAVCSIRPLGGDEGSVIALDTVDLLVEIKPIETLLFTDGFPSRVYPSSSVYELDVHYQGAENMEIAVEVRDPAGAWIGGGLAEVPDGEGVARIQAALITATEVGQGYSWKAHIRPRGSTWRESIFALNFVPFQVVAEPQSELSVFSEGWPYPDTARYLDVSVQYNALEDADMQLMLQKGFETTIADTSFTVEAGSVYLNLKLALPEGLIPGDDYMISASLSRVGTAMLLAADTINMLEIFETEDPVGISPWSSEDLRLYPNPAFGSVTLELHGSSERIAAVRITDITGRIVLLEKKAKTGADARSLGIDISGLPMGFYFISVFTSQHSYTRELMVE